MAAAEKCLSVGEETKTKGIVYTEPTGYTAARIAFQWDAANTRAGLFVNGTLKVLLNQNA